MGGAEVRKSLPAVIIRPLEPLTMSYTIKLTSLDRPFVKLPSIALLVFEHMGHDAIETIKRAISQALVHYYPFAGHIISSGVVDSDEEFSIRCTSNGVEFLTASVDCSLKESQIFDELLGVETKALLNELAVFYPAGSYGFDDPLLSVQVTEFSCGGLVLGVTWNHAIADGIGMGQFLAAVGELARGSPSPSVVPARWDDAVSRLNNNPWPNPILQAMLVCPESQDMELIVPLDITIPSALISRVKAKSSSFFDDGQSCTTFEVILAVLWRCRIRATMSNNNPGNPVYLLFVTNMRKCVGAQDGYYGNCVTSLLVAATRGAVAEAGIVDLIRMIKRAKEQMPDMLKTTGNDDDDQLMRGLVKRYDVMLVSSWRNVGFEQVDFGSGTPARVMYHGRDGTPQPVPFCVVYPRCKGKDGVNVLSLAVKGEHADAFLGELAKHT